MLIRPEQLAALQQAALSRFETEMVEYFRGFAPKLFQIAGEPGIRAVVRLGMDRAEKYRFTNRGPVRFYLELMFSLGTDFDTDPLLPWAAKALKDADPDQTSRARRLFEELNNYLDQVPGPGNWNLLEALRKVGRVGPEQFAVPAGDSFPGRGLRVLYEIYPQKCRHAGRTPMEALIDGAVSCAADHGLAGPAGAGALAELMLFFGYGAPRDPLYPWVGKTLDDPNLSHPNLRAEKLFSRTRTYFEHMLAHLSERGANAE